MGAHMFNVYLAVVVQLSNIMQIILKVFRSSSGRTFCRYESGYESEYESADLKPDVLTKVLTPQLRKDPYICTHIICMYKSD